MRTALLILGIVAMAGAVDLSAGLSSVALAEGDDKEPTYRATIIVDNI